MIHHQSSHLVYRSWWTRCDLMRGNSQSALTCRFIWFSSSQLLLLQATSPPYLRVCSCKNFYVVYMHDANLPRTRACCCPLKKVKLESQEIVYFKSTLLIWAVPRVGHGRQPSTIYLYCLSGTPNTARSGMSFQSFKAHATGLRG